MQNAHRLIVLKGIASIPFGIGVAAMLLSQFGSALADSLGRYLILIVIGLPIALVAAYYSYTWGSEPPSEEIDDWSSQPPTPSPKKIALIIALAIVLLPLCGWVVAHFSLLSAWGMMASGFLLIDIGFLLHVAIRFAFPHAT